MTDHMAYRDATEVIHWLHNVYHLALVPGQYNLFQIYLEGIQYKETSWTIYTELLLK